MVTRRYSLVLLVSVLVILTGFGTVAHALSNGCIGLHCKDHIQSTEHVAAENDSGDKSTSSKSNHHDPDSSGTGECNPSLCQAVVLLAQNNGALLGDREIDPEFQIGALTELTEPESPYRPPDH